MTIQEKLQVLEAIRRDLTANWKRDKDNRNYWIKQILIHNQTISRARQGDKETLRHIY